MPNASIYFDVAFVLVLISLLVQGWTISPAARWLASRSAQRPGADPHRARFARPVGAGTGRLFGRRKQPLSTPGIIPSWAKPTLLVRDERIFTPSGASRAGRRLCLSACAAREGAVARPLLRQYAAAGGPDPRLLGDFFVRAPQRSARSPTYTACRSRPSTRTTRWRPQFADRLERPARKGDIVHIGAIALLAHAVSGGE